MDKKFLSAQAYQRDCWRLAAAIRQSGWQPDYLVGLWRGGAPVAIAVHEFLKATGWNVKHLPLKCWSYTGIGRNESEVRFFEGEAVFRLFAAGERVLFIDDVFDTGRTAAAVLAQMRGRGVDVKIACVYWKPEKNQTPLKPDFFVQDIGCEWIVFPHEIEGLTREEIALKDEVLSGLIP